MGDMIELGDDARGYLAVPDSGSGPGVLVIQEWWGLNPQISHLDPTVFPRSFFSEYDCSGAGNGENTIK